MKLHLTLNCFNWSECILNTNLPANAKYLAIYLATFMNSKQDIAWPQLTRIVKETGLSKPTVIKYLDLLVSNRWLIKNKKIHKVHGEFQPYLHNEYKIDFPDEVKQRLTSFTDAGTIGKTERDQRLNSEAPEVKQVDSNNNRITTNNNICANAHTHTKFQKPTIEEIHSYCTERNNNVDAEKFYYFYESKGWMIGKSKMKSWKAAVHTWERSNVQETAHESDLLRNAI